MKKLYTLLAAVFITASTFAQAPEKMSYQAVIRDAGEVLISNQMVGMQISILQTTATGTSVYTETQSPTTNVNGLVSIEIGTGTTTDDFSAIDWSAGPYFVKTETDPNGGTNYSITGTSQLLSVPYALHAKTATNVFSGDYNDLSNQKWNTNGSDIYNTNIGNVGIDQTNPTEKLDVNGKIKATAYKNTIYEAGAVNAALSNLNNANVWTDYADLNLTFTLTETTTVMCLASISGYSDNNFVVSRIMVDNIQVNRSITGNTQYFSASLQYVSELSPGEHTVKVQYRSPGQGYTGGSDWGIRLLQVLVLGSE